MAPLAWGSLENLQSFVEMMRDEAADAGVTHSMVLPAAQPRYPAVRTQMLWACLLSFCSALSSTDSSNLRSTLRLTGAFDTSFDDLFDTLFDNSFDVSFDTSFDYGLEEVGGPFSILLIALYKRVGDAVSNQKEMLTDIWYYNSDLTR